MAKATAICTCRICGEKFEKTAIRGNRADANSWKDWAEANIDLCPRCWTKEQQQKEIDGGLICKVRLSSAGSYLGAGLWCVAFGDTISIKDALKADGWRWSDRYPDGGALGSLLGASRPKLRWSKRLPIPDAEDAEDELADILKDIERKAEALGMRAEMDISDIDIALYQEGQKAEAEKQAKRAAIEEARGPKPTRPEWMPEGRWNGTIYGKHDKAIYINGDKIELTEDQARELSEYMSSLSAWKKAGEE